MQNNETIKKVKTILMLVGGLLIIFSGLLYTVISDLVLVNNSTWLFLSIFTALGSGVCFLLADRFRNKKKLFYVLKGISLFLSIMFIFVMLGYRGDSFLNKASKSIFGEFVNRNEAIKLVDNKEPIYKIFGDFIRNFTMGADTANILSVKRGSILTTITKNIKTLATVIIILGSICTVVQASNVALNVITGIEE